MQIPTWIDNSFLRTHLAYTECTESPLLMHVWSALSAASACMARHCWLDFGIGKIYPNIFVLLVGPPGTRKSQAISYSRRLLNGNTSVRFAPDDTGGQRQGLIVAIEGDDDDEESLDDIALLEAADNISQLEALSNRQFSMCKDDEHTMFICASEFGSFMGENSKDMTRFLIKMWDGEDYKYKLKTTKNTLTDPLVTMIGGTTATDIASILPPEAIGQGFMSRIILVFAPEKTKKIPRPNLKHTLIPQLKDLYSWLSYELKGEIKESDDAKKLLDRLYLQEVRISDSRFIYYVERRHTHLMKLAMILAATRRSHTIETVDVEQAHIILEHTEDTMPDALGEYGLSPLAVSKQKMVEFIQHAHKPVLSNILWLHLQRDIKLIDFRNSLAELVNAGRIMQVDTHDGPAFVYNSIQEEAISLLANEDELDKLDKLDELEEG